MMEVNNIDEEDENVVIQGSALHEHLSKLGYTDFECVSIPRTFSEEKQYLNINIRSTIRKIYERLFSFYSWVRQEKSISGKQLSVILNAETLLNDHYLLIDNFANKCNDNSKKTRLQELIGIGVVLISSTYILCKYKALPTLLASSVVCYASYLKYSRFCANRDLKNIILLQNELLVMCKESLKILRRNCKVKLNFETCFEQFSHFIGKKLEYLQSLTEILVEFMRNISQVYYQCSLSIAKLLPSNICNENLFTKFEDDSFEISGENYQALKNLYHTYLLVQSEMLYLLAVAYDSDTWIHHCQIIPENKLTRIIHILFKVLIVHKVKLLDVINAYHSCKMEPVRHNSNMRRAKWQDPTVQLDLASYKLQLAYNQVFSIFKDIDDCIRQEIDIDNETTEILMQKLDKAFKEIDIAKSLTEFVVLLMARSGIRKSKNDQSIANNITVDQNLKLPVIIDSDPEILDEVFEEYIKDDYLESLQEETDEYLLEQGKLDKLLNKNFMSELKEALIDKRQSMSERESKALQRMYKNISKDSVMNTEGNKNYDSVSVLPPMPPNYLGSNSSNDINLRYKEILPPNNQIKSDDLSIQDKIDDSDEENDSPKMLKSKNSFNIPSMKGCETENKESLTFSPQILLETRAAQFITKLPPVFLQEETFVGSGENSEDEIIDDSNDNANENNKIK